MEEARWIGLGEVKSKTRACARSGCSTEPRICTTSLPCGPVGVGTGANGGAWRSGAREQFGPEHGFLGLAGSSVTPAEAGAECALALGTVFAFRTVT
jgi:hypothetical protein